MTTKTDVTAGLFYSPDDSSTWTGGADRLLLLADRLEWRIHPTPAPEGTGSGPSLETLKRLLKAPAKKKGSEWYFELASSPGIAPRFFPGWGGDGTARYEVSINPLTILRYRYINDGLYPPDAPKGYKGMDNFIDWQFFKERPQYVHRQQLELLANLVKQQAVLGDGVMRVGLGRAASPGVFMSFAEFVH